MSAAQRSYDEGKVVSLVPDMSIINHGRRPPVPMPRELFGDAWAYVEQVADTTATEPDYAAAALLAVVSSLVGNKRRDFSR